MSGGVSPGLRVSSTNLGSDSWLCRGLVLGEVVAGLGSGLQPVPRAGPSHCVRGH